MKSTMKISDFVFIEKKERRNICFVIAFCCGFYLDDQDQESLSTLLTQLETDFEQLELYLRQREILKWKKFGISDSIPFFSFFLPFFCG